MTPSASMLRIIACSKLQTCSSTNALPTASCNDASELDRRVVSLGSSSLLLLKCRHTRGLCISRPQLGQTTGLSVSHPLVDLKKYDNQWYYNTRNQYRYVLLLSTTELCMYMCVCVCECVCVCVCVCVCACALCACAVPPICSRFQPLCRAACADTRPCHVQA
jgi:hypothetical protein